MHHLANTLPFGLYQKSPTILSDSSKNNDKNYVFAVVPKNTDNEYFQEVENGCEKRAHALTQRGVANVTCLFVGPNHAGPELEENQKAIVEDLIDGKYGDIHGIGLAVVGLESGKELIDKAAKNGIPVVTFDSDAANSRRIAYIGTNNFAMGQELGRVLLQINPNGGSYGVIGAGAPNIRERYRGVKEFLAETAWVEIDGSFKDCKDNATLAAEQMFELSSSHPDINAIIPVGAWPMIDGEKWQEFVDKNKNVLTVVGDSLQPQLTLMNMGYASALVGQLPFQMGTFVIEKLFSQHMEHDFHNGKQIIPTNFIDVINIPQGVPTTIEMNYIGRLSIFGLVMFGMIALLSVGFGVFTIMKKRHSIIRKSQPTFLLMLCVGTLIAGSTIVPMSIDDENYSRHSCDIACMCTPWLISIGFVIIFSALFSKIWRVHMIFQSSMLFRQVTITEMDVITPFAVLLSINIVVLLVWTIVNPLVFERVESSGTDHWNRVYKSYYGACVSSTEKRGGSLPYLIVLGLVNGVIVLFANVQAYRARGLDSQYSEGRYVGLATASLMQALFIGVPMLILIKENPRELYMVMSMLIFITCIVVLMLIYAPKLMYMKEYHERMKARDGGNQNATARNPTSVTAARQSILPSSVTGEDKLEQNMRRISQAETE